MNAGLLLSLYDRVADAPDAVLRLRRFILNLAVRGKLVGQYSSDESASDLLKRIQAEKHEHGEDVGLSASVPAESVAVPSNWCVVPLITLGRWAVGSGFPKSEQGIKDHPYFFLKVSDMNLPGNEKFITTARNSVDEAAVKRIRAKLHPAGTIIFPKIGGAIATNKRRILTRHSAIDNNCLGIVPSRLTDTEWAHLLLSSLDFVPYQAGTAVPALQQRTLAAIPVPLPPRNEQERIVAKVDELMALCDELERGQMSREETRDHLTTAVFSGLTALDAHAPTFRSRARRAVDALPALTARAHQIKHLRRTILDLAVRGKLVEQDPSDEPASRLLDRIAAKQPRVVAAKTGRNARLVPDGACDDLPYDLPASWRWVRFGQLVAFSMGRTPPRKENRFWNNGDYAWVSIGDMTDGGTVISTRESVSEDARSTVFRSEPQPAGTMIMSFKLTIGKIAYLGVPAFHNEAIIAIRPHLKDLSAFLFKALPEVARSGDTRGAIKGSTLNRTSLSNLLIPLPPLAEQDRIVAKIDELMELCDQLEIGVRAADTHRSQLLEALLQDALKPNDAQAEERD